MNSKSNITRVALTGAAGFLGRTMAPALARDFPLRTLDVQPVEGDWERLLGSAANLEDAMALCQGCSHLVISHMAPNRPEIYGTPEIPFDVNVKGVANLFHAAEQCGIRRIALISSTATVGGHLAAGTFLDREMPEHPNSMYALTKALQESIARYYHQEKGMEVAVFRPAHICDDDQLVDKYGKKLPIANWVMIDPRDIAEAVRLALLAPELSYETFYILGHAESALRADLKHTHEFLGWRPQHTFANHPGAVAA